MNHTTRAAEARQQIWGLTIGGFVVGVLGYLVALDGASIDTAFDSASEGQISFGLAVLGIGTLFMLVGLVGLGTMLGIRAMGDRLTAAAPTRQTGQTGTTGPAGHHRPAAGGAGRGKPRRSDPGPMPDWAVKDLDE